MWCWEKTPTSSTSRWLKDLLTPDWPECLVASTSAGVCAIVLHVSSGWGAAKSKAWGAVHLRGGCLAAATVAVAAYAAEGVLRRWARQTAAQKIKTNIETHDQGFEVCCVFGLNKGMCVNSLVETLWRWCLAAIVVYFWWMLCMYVCVQAFGIADMLEDPGSEICQAAVLGQHQSWPRVALCHIQGWDSHGAAHLVHINSVYSEVPYLS